MTEYKNIAILHDYLNQWGGGERVLEAFCELFPNADLYTLLYDENIMKGRFKERVVKTSFLDTSPVRKHHRLFIPLMPIASARLFGKKTYDLVLSSSAGYAKGFGVKAKKHVCYCHTPLRYAWEEEYLKNLPGFWRSARLPARPVRSYLRAWDRRAAQNVSTFVANSNFIKEKIMSSYGREAEVVCPPVDTATFFRLGTERSKQDFYLMAGRLLYYKRFDVGMQACAELGKKLKIAGIGPEERRLKKEVPDGIEFLGRVSDEEMRKLYEEAKALIFPQVEDFGLVAAEAQMCGTPVIGYAKGGIRDIVKDGKTGILFHEQSVEALARAMEKCEATEWDHEYISTRAAKLFSKERFKARIKSIVKGEPNSLNS